ncbi:MAG TPA: YbaK/EbsC family protein [Anaerolineales bacterium]
MDDLTEGRPPASIALETLGIPHQVFRHSGPVDSLEQAARERGERPEQVVRSILFRLGEEQYLLALVAGPAQISWKKLRKYIGRSRLTMASEEEVLAVTGYRIGAVSPFGTRRSLRVLVDPGLIQQDIVSLGSGERGVAIIMKTEDLMRGLGKAEVAELVGAG